MRCEECGAEIPGGERCPDRFHALLAAESENAELRRVHGLSVLTYHLQHPSRTKPWYQAFGRGVMRRVFGGGEGWEAVLLETRPRGIGRRADAAIAKLKAAGPPTMPNWVIAAPIPGEATIASVDLDAASGQEAAILAWAASVAAHRFLEAGER